MCTWALTGAEYLGTHRSQLLGPCAPKFIEQRKAIHAGPWCLFLLLTKSKHRVKMVSFLSLKHRYSTKCAWKSWFEWVFCCMQTSRFQANLAVHQPTRGYKVIFWLINNTMIWFLISFHGERMYVNIQPLVAFYFILGHHNFEFRSVSWIHERWGWGRPHFYFTFHNNFCQF